MEYFLKSTFNGVRIALTAGKNVIGRSRVTKVKNLRCSKKQVELVIDDDSECVRVVATGGNRCCVAGKPLSCGQQASLNPGDWLELLEGDYRFLLEQRPSFGHPLPSSSACPSPCSSSSRSPRQLAGSKRVQSADGSISRDSPAKKRCTAVGRGSTLDTVVDEKVWTSLDGDSMYLMMTPGVKASAKIAGFDMDHTLITTKSGKVFPRDSDDWRLMYTETPGKLKKLVKDGYKIVIFTNQMGLSRGKLSPVDLGRKLSAVAARLGVPVQGLVAPRDGKYRKPMLGMWQYLTEQGNGGVTVDMAESFYCGDAACRELAWAPGRKKDFSGSDRLFALNVGVPFFTPEEYFLGYPCCRKYQLPEFDPRKAVADARLLSQPVVARSGREVAVLVGAPGSGKSHLAQRHLAAAGYRVANRDSLMSWQKCVQLVDDSLKVGCSVVVDNTNGDAESRKRYIDVARRHDVTARCILMQTSLSQSRHNNKFRELVDPSHQRVSEMVFNVYNERRTLAIPVNIAGQFEKCRMYSVNYTWLWRQRGSSRWSSLANASWPRHECTHGWEYDATYYQTTLAAQLNLVCEDAWKSSFCTTLFYTGSLLGNVIYGWVADKWGRRLAIFAILSVAIPVSTLTAFVSSYPVYAVLRTVLGLTFPALYQIPFILALEMMGPAYRTFAGMIICVFFAASLALLSGLARLCQDWFILTLVTSVPFFGLVSYWWIIPESPRWLIQKGRIAEAEVIVQKMAKTNGRPLPDNYLEGLKSLGDRPAASSSDEAGCGSNSIRPLLFGYPNLRKKFLIIAFSWTANAVVYNGLSYNATNLGVSDYLAFFIGAVVEIPSYFLTYFAMERLGRRVCLCVTMLLGGLACISCLLVPADVVWLTVTLAMVGKFGIASSFAVIYVYAGELLPTVIRSQAMALASFFAGLGLLCFPQIVQLGSYSPVLPLVVMGLVMLLGSMVSFFLPETVHQHLPETLQEGEDFGKNTVCCQSFSSCLGGARKRPKRRDSSEESDPALRLTSGEEQRNAIEQASTGDG